MTGQDVALVLSGIAIGLSALSFVYTHLNRRRDRFLDMHDRLQEREIRDGRRALLEASIRSVDDARRFRDEDPGQYQLACRALAMCDVLGLYVEERFIRKSLVLHEWGHTYSALWEAGRHIIGMRLADDGEDVGHRWSAWPNLQKFGAEASAWVQMQPPRGLLEAPSPPDKRPR